MNQGTTEANGTVGTYAYIAPGGWFPAVRFVVPLPTDLPSHPFG